MLSSSAFTMKSYDDSRALWTVIQAAAKIKHVHKQQTLANPHQLGTYEFTRFAQFC